MEYCCEKLDKAIEHNYLGRGVANLCLQQFNQRRDVWEVDIIYYCPFCGKKLDGNTR